MILYTALSYGNSVSPQLCKNHTQQREGKAWSWTYSNSQICQSEQCSLMQRKRTRYTHVSQIPNNTAGRNGHFRSSNHAEGLSQRSGLCKWWYRTEDGRLDGRISPDAQQPTMKLPMPPTSVEISAGGAERYNCSSHGSTESSAMRVGRLDTPLHERLSGRSSAFYWWVVQMFQKLAPDCTTIRVQVHALSSVLRSVPADIEAIT